jgi:hypothetical protein
MPRYLKRLCTDLSVKTIYVILCNIVSVVNISTYKNAKNLLYYIEGYTVKNSYSWRNFDVIKL